MTESNDSGHAMEEDAVARILQLTGSRPRPPADMHEEVKSAVHAAWKDEVARAQRRRQSRWMAMAATLAAVALLAVWQYQTPAILDPVARVSSGTATNLITGEVISTDKSPAITQGTRLATSSTGVAFVLGNGMHIRLDSDSGATVAADDTVRLERGRLYADSYDGSTSPTVVMVDTHHLTDVGTQFMVSTDHTGWAVQVREGRVNVSGTADTAEIGAGRKLHVGANGLERHEDIAADDLSWRWAERLAPSFDTNGQSLLALAEWAARETGRSLEFANDDAKSLAAETILSGSVTGTPSQALGLALSASGFKDTSVDGAIVLQPVD
jgi:ferric-dicitrate binding protein FerR (iron transport regulator)